MNPWKLIYSGIIVLTASVLIPTLIMLWAFYASFNALRTNQTAGVGAIMGGIEIAIFIEFLGIVGVLTGLILLIVGIVKNSHQSKSQN